jgi:hypothetical protein
LYWIYIYIYRCFICGIRFPIWWINSKDWKKSKFGKYEKLLSDFELGGSGTGYGAKVCKSCFEEHVKVKPHYCTLDEYLEERPGDDRKRRVLSAIWDLPDENGDVSCKECDEIYDAGRFDLCPACLRREIERNPKGEKAKMMAEFENDAEATSKVRELWADRENDIKKIVSEVPPYNKTQVNYWIDKERKSGGLHW